MNGKVTLLTGNSFEILGKKIDEENTLGLLNFETNHQEKRITEDVICTSKYLRNKVVGFINTMSVIKNIEEPLFKVEWGVNEENEGIKYKNVYGTHIIGPILVRNPELLKILVEEICKQKNPEFEYKEIEYEDEKKGYELVLQELENRRSEVK